MPRTSTTAEAAVHVLGIRHHGPGSARSVLRALAELKPDAVLVEGPPDADALLPLLTHKEMTPPVALLVYAADRPRDAAYYPFAVFSPEWQAIRHALTHKVPVRFMDLPQAHQLLPAPEPPDLAALAAAAPPDEPEASERAEGNGEVEAEHEQEPDGEPEDGAVDGPPPEARRDPLGWLAEAAGFSDGERWWEHLVEHRRDATDLFAAILEAMTALREEFREPLNEREARREAFMRRTIRGAIAERSRRIAVVCGAWHAPALVDLSAVEADEAVLRGLPKAKVAATWVPWTYGRLSYESGYGAGVESPGWYHHLWEVDEHVVTRWLTRVARLLREADIDASSAHIIESVRLAEALAALHGRPLPGLPEIDEAVRATLCHGDDAPMRIIRDKLVVGERLGKVPDETPMVPLQQDLVREQKRLRLPPQAAQEVKDLDLRNATDLDRSRLLHRLGMLGVPWGEVQEVGGKSGTFHEYWRLKWQPEFEVALIEAGTWGNTILDAASTKAREAAAKAADLPALTELLDRALLADLPEAVADLMRRLESEAALASDVTHLMGALPPLANVLRYGDVRKTDTTAVGRAVDGIVARICINLPGACGSLDDDAASGMFDQVLKVDAAIGLIQDDDHRAAWHAVLGRLADRRGVHGLLQGRACRILLDAGKLSAEEAADRLGLGLSAAVDPPQAAAWIEGLLKGSGLILLHDEALWAVLDRWVADMHPDAFLPVLPLVRRTFSTFPAPERRQMGERARRGPARPAAAAAPASMTDFDLARAEAVLPRIAALLGLPNPTASPAPAPVPEEAAR